MERSEISRKNKRKEKESRRHHKLVMWLEKEKKKESRRCHKLATW